MLTNLFRRLFPTATISMKPIKIGTHNGPFHCDEVLAVTMLKLLPAYAGAEIVRSR